MGRGQRASLGDDSAAELWDPGLSAVSRNQWNGYSYIVVEEIFDDDAELVLSAWPRLDERGRLRFSDETERRSVDVSRTELQAALSDRRYVSPRVERLGRDQLQRRSVAVGDVFALLGSLDDVAKLLEKGSWATLRRHAIYDITAMARDAAKAAMYAALTRQPLREDEAVELVENAPRDSRTR